MLESLPGKIFPKRWELREMLRHFVSRQISRISDYSAAGSLQRTQTYLIMSHDSNQGVLTLEKDEPGLEFLGVGRSDHVQKLNAMLAKATDAIGGKIVLLK
jgi:hypothetical protein